MQLPVKFLGAYTSVGGKWMRLDHRSYIRPRFDGHQYIAIYAKELEDFPKGKHVE